MKLWITKYAITAGIQEVEADVSPNYPGMIWVKSEGAFPDYLWKPYWHESKEAANHHANEIVAAKIRSLEQQLKRLRGLKF